MSDLKARALLWSPVLLVAAVRVAHDRGLLDGSTSGWLFTLLGFGYYLLTGLLAVVAGEQAARRHGNRLSHAATAGALVASAVAAPLLRRPVSSLLRGQPEPFDLSRFLLIICLLAAVGALLGLLGGWLARQERVCHAT